MADRPDHTILIRFVRPAALAETLLRTQPSDVIPSAWKNNEMLEALGHRLATFLSREGHVHSTSPPTNQEVLKRTIRPADVLLVEGTSIISTAIKYLTQSTWSHAALYVGDAIQGMGEPRDDHILVYWSKPTSCRGVVTPAAACLMYVGALA